MRVPRPTFAAYAERHGYELITSTEALRRPPAWAKVPMLREAARSYELVLWIDADAVIVDGAATSPTSSSRSATWRSCGTGAASSWFPTPV